MADLVVKIEGAEELIRELRALGVNVKKTLRGAMRKGAKLIQAEAEQRAPSSRKGKKTALQVSSPRRDQIEARLKPAKRVWYLRFAETGATPHEIRGRGKRLVFEGERGLVRVPRVQHPGVAARPWLRPAFDAQKDAAVEAIGEALRAAVEQARIEAEGKDDG